MSKQKFLRVVAKRDNFRRAGFVFGSKPKDIALQTLDEEQLAAIKGDAMLVTTEVELETATENVVKGAEDKAETPPKAATKTSTTKTAKEAK